MPESFYQQFNIKRLSRLMTKIKEKTYHQLGKRKHRHTFLLETASEHANSEMDYVLKDEPITTTTTIENPVLPVICSLPPPPRYTQPHLIHAAAHTKIQTRSSFMIATATKKPCLSRSNTLGHPSPLGTPDQDHPSPMSAADEVTPSNKPYPLPLELYTDILLLDKMSHKQTQTESPFPSSRTPSLVNFPDSPSSSISRV